MKTLNAKIFVLLIVIFLQSCQQEDITTPKENNQMENPYLSLIDEEGQSGYLYSLLIRTMNNEGGFSDSYQEYSYFYDDFGQSILAQSVSLNGVFLNQRYDTKEILFDGSQHIWDVVANPPLESYSDTINSINSFTIEQPRSFVDTVNTNQGIQLRYSKIDNVDSVLIMVETDNFIAHFLVDSTINANSPHISKYILVPNTGFYTVLPSFLDSFPDRGVLKISVIASRSKTKDVNNKSFLVATLTACISYNIFHKL